jgi:hypothetical protein
MLQKYWYLGHWMWLLCCLQQLESLEAQLAEVSAERTKASETIHSLQVLIPIKSFLCSASYTLITVISLLLFFCFQSAWAEEMSGWCWCGLGAQRKWIRHFGVLHNYEFTLLSSLS